ncbi:MAG: hypothetical protein U0521_07995 [Anaerolineae bacterium]
MQLIHPDDADRLAQLGIIASMQPIHATSDYPVADRYWGARTPYSYNPRLQLIAAWWWRSAGICPSSRWGR